MGSIPVAILPSCQDMKTTALRESCNFLFFQSQYNRLFMIIFRPILIEQLKMWLSISIQSYRDGKYIKVAKRRLKLLMLN